MLNTKLNTSAYLDRNERTDAQFYWPFSLSPVQLCRCAAAAYLLPPPERSARLLLGLSALASLLYHIHSICGL